MSFAYLPLYTGDYIRDTQHLSCTEHGIYIKLLIHCWDQKGPAPADERRLMGIVNARSTDEIEAMRRVLLEYFVRMDDGWYNQRMQREIERCENISTKREDAGRRGANERMRRFRAAQASAELLPSNCQASDKQVTLSPSPSPSTETSKALSGKPDESIIVLEFLNKVTGRQYRPVAANLDMIRARIKEGYSVVDLKAIVAEKTTQWQYDEVQSRYLRPATLFNRTKCAQYIAEVSL